MYTCWIYAVLTHHLVRVWIKQFAINATCKNDLNLGFV